MTRRATREPAPADPADVPAGNDQPAEDEVPDEPVDDEYEAL